MRAKLKKMLKNQKGMTLVELLAVIVILGIIAAIAIPSVNNIIEKSKNDADKSNALMIINAVKIAIADQDSTIISNPNSSSNSVTLTQLVDEGYLNEVPNDPHNKGQQYSPNSKVTITKKQNSEGKYTYSYKITLSPTSGNAYITNKSETDLNGAK